MPALFLAFLTCALALVGSRSALVAARLSGALSGGAGLLAVCWSTTAAASVLAGYAGAWLAPLMAPAARGMFVALALLLAGVELIVGKAPARAAEPTPSLAAISIVLLAGQLTDAARLLIVALAVATRAPAMAALGGALGSGAMLTVAWALDDDWEAHVPLRTVSRALGGLFLLAAIVVGLSARGAIG